MGQETAIHRSEPLHMPSQAKPSLRRYLSQEITVFTSQPSRTVTISGIDHTRARGEDPGAMRPDASVRDGPCRSHGSFPASVAGEARGNSRRIEHSLFRLSEFLKAKP